IPRAASYSGARVDPVAMGIDLDDKALKQILEPQKNEYSAKFLNKKSLKPSELGLAAIPPSDEGLAGIATKRIIRSHVLSFALLRRLRFGAGPGGDVAIRTFIAAALIDAMVRSDSELQLRANCHLVEKEAPRLSLDRRFGERLELEPLTIETADGLLEEAYRAASAHGVDWNGVTLAVKGNDLIWG